MHRIFLFRPTLHFKKHRGIFSNPYIDFAVVFVRINDAREKFSRQLVNGSPFVRRGFQIRKKRVHIKPFIGVKQHAAPGLVNHTHQPIDWLPDAHPPIHFATFCDVVERRTTHPPFLRIFTVRF